MNSGTKKKKSPFGTARRKKDAPIEIECEAVIGRTGPRGAEATEHLDDLAIERGIATLRGLTPPGWRCFVPNRPAPPSASGDRAARWRPDLDDYLRMFVFAQETTIRNGLDRWASRFSRRIGPSRGLSRAADIIECLEDLVHAGADPYRARDDLELAGWELRLQAAMDDPAWRRRSRRPDDDRVVIAADACREWIAGRAESARARGRLRPDRFTRSGTAFDALNPRGVLGSMGYACGDTGRTNGIYTSDRRDALRDVMCLSVAGSHSTHAAAWWGRPGTRGRARAIERCIEFFHRVARARTHGDWSRSLRDWEADLAWLRQEWLG